MLKANTSEIDIYGGCDPREIPAYRFTDAARYLNVGRDSQLAMRQVLHAYLTRVEHDPSGKAARLYPFIRLDGTEQPKNVVINPYISFGKPVLSGTGLPTRVVAERYKAGDSIPDIARDYGREEEEIDDAIRYELRIA